MISKSTKVTLSVTLSAFIISLASFASPAQAEDSAEPIKIALNSWSSQRVLAHITGLLLNKIGYNVEYHQADAQRQFAEMGSGNLHYQAEVWQGSMAAPFARQIRRKNILDAGSHKAVTREDWWYPDYVAKICPGLPDWKALNKCAEKLSTDATKPSGRYLAGPTDWGRSDRDRIEALQLNFEVENEKDYQSLRAKLDQAIANKKPILVYNWTPNWSDGKYSGRFVNFPSYSKDCETKAEWGVNPKLKQDCGNPKKGWLKKAVWSEFPNKWSCGFKLIKNIKFTNKQIKAAASFAEVDEMSPEEAAKRWMSENQKIWSKWMPSCADSVKIAKTNTEEKSTVANASAVVDATELAKKSNCLACHSVENKIVGPSFKEIAAKYKNDDSAVSTLMSKIKNGGSGNWGAIPMPANPGVSDTDSRALVEWILSK